MRQLTRTVLGQALRQGGGLAGSGPRRSGVAVNMSVTNLLDVALPRPARAMLLDGSGFPGRSWRWS